jgi:hypothetical protein
MTAQTVRVRFPDAEIRPVRVDHWVDQIIGRPIGGGAPIWALEPDWPRVLPGFEIRRVAEKGFDYIAFQAASWAARPPSRRT